MSKAYPAKRLDRKVVGVKQFIDPISGKRLTTFMIEKEITANDPIPYQTYFLGLDIANLLEYKDSRGLVKRIPTEDKYLIMNEDFRVALSATPKLNNHGAVIIDFPSVSKLLVNSRLKTATPYQTWVNTVMNSLLSYGYYMDPVRTYNEINGVFSRLLYSYTPAEGEKNVIDLLTVKEKKLNIIKNNNYVAIADDPNLKRRIYNLAFFSVFNISIFNDPNYSFIDNPFSVAYDICGYDGVMMIKGVIDSLLIHLQNGASIEFLESWYSRCTYDKLYAVPNGEAYKNYHITKNNYIEEDPYVDDKHSYGINVDSMVDKE